eukprot:766328-Hanusia_phi.AAC.15
MRGLQGLLVLLLAVGISIEVDETVQAVAWHRSPPLTLIRGGNGENKQSSRARLGAAKKRWQEKKAQLAKKADEDTRSQIATQDSSSLSSELLNFSTLSPEVFDDVRPGQDFGGWSLVAGGKDKDPLQAMRNKSSAKRRKNVDKYKDLSSRESTSISQSEKELQILRKRIVKVNPSHPLAGALDVNDHSEQEEESVNDEDLLRDSDMYEKDGDYLVAKDEDGDMFENASSLSSLQVERVLCHASELEEGLPYHAVLDEHWAPSCEDSDLLSFEAGR